MRIACADFSWPGLSHDLALDIIRELGCEGVLFGLTGDYSLIHVDTVRARTSRSGRGGRRARARPRPRAGRRLPDRVDGLAAMAVNHPDAGERERSDVFLREMVDFTVHRESTA